MVAELFPRDEVTESRGGTRAATHRMLLRCALLLHSHATWTPEQVAMWLRCTGSPVVSARALCDAITRSGITQV